jgi:hypothetical protein
VSRAFCFAAAVVHAFVSCGPPPSNCCIRQSSIARGTVYAGTMPSPDGGAPTQVRVSVAEDGGTTVTFVHDGHEIVQGFNATAVANP